MRFIETSLSGAYVIEPEPRQDERGLFARVFCREEFAEKGLNADFVQCNISHNIHKGTLRGMHYQAVPYAEIKLVRCTRGRIYDVIVDARSHSSTFRQWFGIELAATNRLLLYVPQGFAHGYLTLEDDTEVFYQVSQFYAPEFERGVRWDSPDIGIIWPFAPTRISEKDTRHPYYL